jgi:hypothetical protein
MVSALPVEYPTVPFDVPGYRRGVSADRRDAPDGTRRRKRMQIDLWTYEIILPEMADLNRFDVEATDGSIGYVDEARYEVGSS